MAQWVKLWFAVLLSSTGILIEIEPSAGLPAKCQSWARQKRGSQGVRLGLPGGWQGPTCLES